MDLSTIIVNFNTRDLLRQCLASLDDSRSRLKFEVIIVDNASTDGSVEMVKKEFPWVTVIASSTNDGFSKANNKGIAISKGRYLLFLNPDTTVPKETLPKMLEFMDENSEVGVSTCCVELVGGRMDPDCHRGFPTPWASFTHFSGLARLFPRSHLFGHYHMGWLPKDTIHGIEACCGAFMMVRRKAMEQIGGWDEDYFFYGEDLDWCYRFMQAGWKVMFYPKVKIIHHKGAASGMKKGSQTVTTATRKTRLRVARASADAMRIFYDKHYRNKYPFFVAWLVYLGVFIIRASRLIKAVSR